MKTGDLVAFRGTGFVSWVIRKWTDSPYSHVGVLWVHNGVELVLEAMPGQGVACNALGNRMKDRPIVFVTGREVEIHRALPHLGDRYSFLDAVEAGLDGRESDGKGWQCAMFAAWLLGIDHTQEGLTPEKLVDIVAE